MKRTFLGVLVMGSLVGLGSAGVYFARQHLAPHAVAAAPSDATADDASDKTPKPIPVSKRMPAATASGSNPFGGGQAVPVAEDRYASDDRYPAEDRYGADDRYQTYDAAAAAADDIPDARQAAAYEPAESVADAYDDAQVAAATAAESDIPDAAQMAGGVVAAAGAARYAEQPAQYVDDSAAEAPVNQFAETDAEPRHLTPQPAEAAADPYAAPAAGNPLRGAAPVGPAPTSAPQYDDQAFPAEPAANPYAAQAAPQEPAAFGTETESFGAAIPEEGTGRPGDPQLSGIQAPALTIEKAAPPEIQIGKPAKFQTKVKNVGTATAHGVEVHDTIPQGTQLMDTNPPANRGADGELTWDLGTLKPGNEQTIETAIDAHRRRRNRQRGDGALPRRGFGAHASHQADAGNRSARAVEGDEGRAIHTAKSSFRIPAAVPPAASAHRESAGKA